MSKAVCVLSGVVPRTGFAVLAGCTATLLATSVGAQSPPRVVLSWPASEWSFAPETATRLDGSWGVFQGQVSKNGARHELRLDLVTVQRAGNPRPIESLNVPDARDRSAILTPDGLTLIYGSNRNGHFDLFTSSRDALGSAWSAPVSISELNTDGDEVFPALSPDGLRLVFADSFSIPSVRDGNQGSADLWLTQRASPSARWQPPVHLGGVVNRPSWDSGPAFSPDGRTLYFSSDRRGGFGGSDLYSITQTNVADLTAWSAPVNLGAAINSGVNDCCPSFSPDGLLLFFSSARLSPGRPAGVNSLWMARRESLDAPFGEPVSLGGLLPEFDGVFDPHLTPDGSSLIFASVGLLASPSAFGDLWEVPVRTGVVESNRFFRLQPAYTASARVEGPFPLGNFGSRERGPDFSPDGRTLYFCADPDDHMDLWIATRTAGSGPWSETKSLTAVNTSAHEAFPAIAADERTLYFTDWFLGLENFRPDGFGKGDIWVSVRSDPRSDWGSPANLGPAINSEHAEGTPDISHDGRTLIFCSDRPGHVPNSRGGFDALDLWVSERLDSTSPLGWGPPVNLGPRINSVYADWSPKFSSDGLALYFVSNRPGIGRRDVAFNIWVARRSSAAEPFEVPVNLEPHFTSLLDLLDPCPSPDGLNLFFATRGQFSETPAREYVDVWQARLQPPPPISLHFPGTLPNQP